MKALWDKCVKLGDNENDQNFQRILIKKKQVINDLLLIPVLVF